MQAVPDVNLSLACHNLAYPVHHYPASVLDHQRQVSPQQNPDL